MLWPINLSFNLSRITALSRDYKYSCYPSKFKYCFKLNFSFYCRGNKCYFQRRTDLIRRSNFNVIYFDYLVIYLINNWIKAQFIPLLIFTIIYIIGYLIIWTIIYRKVKSQVKQINQKL